MIFRSQVRDRPGRSSADMALAPTTHTPKQAKLPAQTVVCLQASGPSRIPREGTGQQWSWCPLCLVVLHTSTYFPAWALWRCSQLYSTHEGSRQVGKALLPGQLSPLGQQDGHLEAGLLKEREACCWRYGASSSRCWGLAWQTPTGRPRDARRERNMLCSIPAISSEFLHPPPAHCTLLILDKGFSPQQDRGRPASGASAHHC